MLTHTHKKNNNSLLESTALLTGFEPAIFTLGGQRVIQLRYRDILFDYVHCHTLCLLKINIV